jgi:hypothetical protein
MRATIFLVALLGGALSASASAPFTTGAAQQESLQRSTDLSATTKRKTSRSAQPGSQPFRRLGPADPSIGPDGRPYPVPEYLRGQCYIDDGYGRFSACNNRN